MTATELYWGEPLGFCIGFTPNCDLSEGDIEIGCELPLLSDDNCPSHQAAIFHSGDDIIVQAETEPPTPVQHPTQGELWPQPDAILFRSQAELDAWLKDMFVA